MTEAFSAFHAVAGAAMSPLQRAERGARLKRAAANSSESLALAAPNESCVRDHATQTCAEVVRRPTLLRWRRCPLYALLLLHRASFLSAFANRSSPRFAVTHEVLAHPRTA